MKGEICLMKYELQKTDIQSKARAGKMTTAHGEILTPIFMPVGTAATVKAVHQRELVLEFRRVRSLFCPHEPSFGYQFFAIRIS